MPPLFLTSSLGALEREVLRLLAVNRNPDSYVAGATVLNQNPASPRTSRDVDVFHDTIESLAQSADRDFAKLRAAGFEVIDNVGSHCSVGGSITARFPDATLVACFPCSK